MGKGGDAEWRARMQRLLQKQQQKQQKRMGDGKARTTASEESSSSSSSNSPESPLPPPPLKEVGDPRSALYAGSESTLRPKPHQRADAAWAFLESVEASQGRLTLSSFHVVRKIGSGAVADVYLVSLPGHPKQRFALKVLQKSKLFKLNKVKRIVMEHRILSAMDHPFVVTLYRTFNTAAVVAFLMEHCAYGDMYQHLHRQPAFRLSERVAKAYAAQVLCGLQYMHVQGFVYRDLKPENLLLSKQGHVVLSDFDLSRRAEHATVRLLDLSQEDDDARTAHDAGSALALAMGEGLSSASASSCPGPSAGGSAGGSGGCGAAGGGGLGMRKSRSMPDMLSLCAVPDMRTTSFVGTDEYIAPEIVKGAGYSSSVDWWSLGILIFEMVYGRTPFEAGGNRSACFKRIVEEPLVFPTAPKVSKECRDLIACLLRKDPKERLGSTLGATEVQSHAFFDDIKWPLLRTRRSQ